MTAPSTLLLLLTSSPSVASLGFRTPFQFHHQSVVSTKASNLVSNRPFRHPQFRVRGLFLSTKVDTIPSFHLHSQVTLGLPASSRLQPRRKLAKVAPPGAILLGHPKRFMSRIDNSDTGETDGEGLSAKEQPAKAILSNCKTFQGKVVPLGKSAGLTVRRILPYYQQRSVGPFVFLDHFQPEPSGDKEGSKAAQAAMDVGPHPHIGLATLSYLYQGSILHRDSTGAERLIVPEEVNFMVSGRGVVHSERGRAHDIQTYINKQGKEALGSGITSNDTLFDKQHGLQFWMALSKEGEDVPPSFHHGKGVPIELGLKSKTQASPSMSTFAMLVVGALNGIVQHSIPIDPNLDRVFCADVHLSQEGDSFDIIELRTTSSSHSHILELGLYLVSGSLEFVPNSECIADGRNGNSGTQVDNGCDDDANTKNKLDAAGTMTVYKMTLTNPNDRTLLGQIRSLSPDTRVAVLGGTPLPEQRHMRWNFVSTDLTKIDQASVAWSKLDRSMFPPVVNEDNLDSIPMPQRNSKANS